LSTPLFFNAGTFLLRDTFHRDGWVYEGKVDGWRMLAYKDGVRVRLVSRNGRDHTRRFVGIAAAIAKLTVRPLVLDGEVAIFDQKLRPRFAWLREPDRHAVDFERASRKWPAGTLEQASLHFAHGHAP